MEQHSLFKYIPKFIRKRLEGRPEFQRVLKNSGWLFADTAIRMGGGLIVGIWIARYLGPTEYGILNYAVSFVLVVGSFASLGLESVVIRELVQFPSNKSSIIYSSFWARLAASTAASIFVLLISWLSEETVIVLHAVFIVTPILIFQSFDVFDHYFQSQSLSRFTVMAKTGSFLIMLFIKIYLLLTAASLNAFIITYTAEVILTASILACFFIKFGKTEKGVRFDYAVLKKLLKSGWPLMLSSIAVSVYMKIDQIMLKNMMGEDAVGKYSVAVRLSELWYFIPVIIANSVFPSILRARAENYNLYIKRLQKLYNVMIHSAVSIAVLITFVSEPLINLLYRSEYAEAPSVLRIHIWAGVFVFFGVASSKFLVAENLEKISFYRTLAGAVINIGLNFLLIPYLGILGAALSTLMSYAFTTLLLIFDKRARVSLVLLLNTLNFFRIKNAYKALDR